MFSSAAKLAPGLDPAPVPTVGSLGRNRLGLLFGTPLIPVGLALKYAPNPQAPSPSESFAGRVNRKPPVESTLSGASFLGTLNPVNNAAHVPRLLLSR